VALSASVLAALLLAACGGYSGSSGTTPAGGGSSGTTPAGAAASRYGSPVRTAPKPMPGKPASSQTNSAAQNQEGSAPAAGAAERKPAPARGAAPMAQSDAGAIPQNNGGDQDADNDGGPSDGDGNV